MHRDVFSAYLGCFLLINGLLRRACWLLNGLYLAPKVLSILYVCLRRAPLVWLIEESSIILMEMNDLQFLVIPQMVH